MKSSRPLRALTAALIGVTLVGCGSGTVDQGSIPHPEREKAVDKASPAFQKLEGKGARR